MFWSQLKYACYNGKLYLEWFLLRGCLFFVQWSIAILWAVIFSRASYLQLPCQVYSRTLLVLSLVSYLMTFVEHLQRLSFSTLLFMDSSVPGMQGGYITDWKFCKIILVMICNKQLRSMTKSLCLEVPLSCGSCDSFHCEENSEIVWLSFLDSTSCIWFWSVWFKRTIFFLVPLMFWFWYIIFLLNIDWWFQALLNMQCL